MKSISAKFFDAMSMNWQYSFDLWNSREWDHLDSRGTANGNYFNGREYLGSVCT